MTSFYVETGLRLQRIETASEKTGAVLARLSNNRIPANRWSEWRQGKRLITIESAIELCGITGVTLDYIYRGDTSGLPLRLAEALRKIDG